MSPQKEEHHHPILYSEAEVDYDMAPMAVQFSPVADSIDRFDSEIVGGNEPAPPIRTNFPESFLWENLDGYDDIDHLFYVFSFWFRGCFLSVV